MITLLVLGAGGATPTRRRGPAAYWLEIDGHGLLLEAGCGALAGLMRRSATVSSVDRIDTVLLSHLHLDHAADLAPLLFALHSVLAANEAPLLLAGPPGLEFYLERLRDLYGDWLTPHRRRVDVREIGPGEVLPLPGAGQAEAFAVDHGERRFSRCNLGWIFRDARGRRLVYSGDTGPCATLVAAAADCDLLLVECSTPDHLAVDGHLCPARVIDLVRADRPRRVVLTHLYPPVARQRPAATIARATGISCRAALDGDAFHLGGSEVPA